jgi:hypothetical protein
MAATIKFPTLYIYIGHATHLLKDFLILKSPLSVMPSKTPNFWKKMLLFVYMVDQILKNKNGTFGGVQ